MCCWWLSPTIINRRMYDLFNLNNHLMNGGWFFDITIRTSCHWDKENSRKHVNILFISLWNEVHFYNAIGSIIVVIVVLTINNMLGHQFFSWVICSLLCRYDFVSDIICVDYAKETQITRLVHWLLSSSDRCVEWHVPQKKRNDAIKAPTSCSIC